MVQQRLRDVSEPQQLLWHRAEVEHAAYRHQLRVDGVDFDDVIYLRANMQHHLLHVRRTHARAVTHTQSCTSRTSRGTSSISHWQPSGVASFFAAAPPTVQR